MPTCPPKQHLLPKRVLSIHIQFHSCCSCRSSVHWHSCCCWNCKKCRTKTTGKPATVEFDSIQFWAQNESSPDAMAALCVSPVNDLNRTSMVGLNVIWMISTCGIRDMCHYPFLCITPDWTSERLLSWKWHMLVLLKHYINHLWWDWTGLAWSRLLVPDTCMIWRAGFQIPIIGICPQS